jgi:hypothetical protein
VHDAVRGFAAFRFFEDVTVFDTRAVMDVAMSGGCAFKVGVLLTLLQAPDFFVHSAVCSTFTRSSVQPHAAYKLQ